MFNCTETPFICVSRVQIIGLELEGPSWFVAMLLVAFCLQVGANFLWLKNSQISREILQIKNDNPKRVPLVYASVGWTALSTVVWIARIIFVIGNNLWIFLIILLGNCIGTYFASSAQCADEDTTLDVLLNEFQSPSAKAKKLALLLATLHEKKVRKVFKY